MKRHIIYLSVIALLIIIFFLRERYHDALENKYSMDLISYKDTAKIERLKNGALVFSNNSLKLKTEEQLKLLISQDETTRLMVAKFKSLSNVTNITNVFQAGGDSVNNPIEIPCDFKPFQVTVGTDSTYKLLGTISKKTFSVDNLKIIDKETLVFGRKKAGFMKHDYVVDINHTNKLMTTSNIKDYKYVPDKKWYEKTWVHMGAGGAIAVIIIKGITYLIPR